MPHRSGVIIIQVKALVHAPATIAIPKVGSEARSGIPRGSQNLGERPATTVPGMGPISAVLVGQEPGEHGCVGGQSPGTWGDGIFEDHAASRPFVEIRRGRTGVSVERQVVRPNRVEGNQYDVWIASAGFRACG